MRKDKQAVEMGWRPYEFVLRPRDLQQIQYIEDIHQLQWNIAELNIELRRIFMNPSSYTQDDD